MSSAAAGRRERVRKPEGYGRTVNNQVTIPPTFTPLGNTDTPLLSEEAKTLKGEASLIRSADKVKGISHHIPNISRCALASGG